MDVGNIWKLSVSVMLISLLLIAFFQNATIQLSLNALEKNDKNMVEIISFQEGLEKYVLANSQAIEFIQGCKIIKDNNTTIDLTCFKNTGVNQ
jgi:hypothetical protein